MNIDFLLNLKELDVKNTSFWTPAEKIQGILEVDQVLASKGFVI
jgi:hypothetical protein